MGEQTEPPIRVGALKESGRADLVFGGVEQAGPSWEGRVFLNNPGADESTPRNAGAGYAGSFHVYGYGDPAPPDIAERKARQEEGGPAVAPIEKRLHADPEALRSALSGTDELTVTVVAVPADPGGAVPERPYERLEIVFG